MNSIIQSVTRKCLVFYGKERITNGRNLEGDRINYKE